LKFLTLARTVTWKGSRRFDTYRGIMEYVYSDKKDVMYIVNELPMSSYIAGIGEMSDSAPFEYMKAFNDSGSELCLLSFK